MALFAAAYMAEVIRGGLQAIPKGQYEGAEALGLGYWQMMRLIILPQALKLVIPGIVNTFIGLFKDTTLVDHRVDLRPPRPVARGLLRPELGDAGDAVHRLRLRRPRVFLVFCFGMSRYSMFVEKRLDTAYRR